MIRLIFIFLLGGAAFAFSGGEPRTSTDYKAIKGGKFYRIVNHESVTIFCDYNNQFITIRAKAKSTWFRVNGQFNYRCKM
jgi:hypothetical protein